MVCSCMIAAAPGKQFSMEKAPFKLTEEFVQVLGGRYTPEFTKFARLLRKGFVCARKHAKEVITLMEIMLHESTYPCFR
jgi:phosphatidylinositol kinase/protein kinase (PI-3  family)